MQHREEGKKLTHFMNIYDFIPQVLTELFYWIECVKQGTGFLVIYYK